MRIRKIVAIMGMSALMAAVTAGCGTQEDAGGQTAPPAAVSTQAVSGAGTGQDAEDKTGTPEEVKNASVLKDAFQNDFLFGASIVMGELNNDKEMDFVQKHFNSITMGNEMKPESLLDWEASEKSADGMPEIRTEQLDKVLGRVQERGLKLRGHCLVWHSQTPDWFFSKNYEPSKGLVDKETMKKRMEAYIQKVLTYCQKNYPGVIYAWDVTNEVIEDDGGYRTESGWYQTYGDESYITDAFTFARKYADPNVKLFMNDYNEYVYAKRDMIIEKVKELQEKGLIDGIGMQSHWDMQFPDTFMLEEALEEYGKIGGLEIHLTEIDMHNTDSSDEGYEKQAERYKEFFEIILRADRTGAANITSVTFWGTKDDYSWLSGHKGETSYPLLFDEDYKEKPCYAGILEAAKEEYK